VIQILLLIYMERYIGITLIKYDNHTIVVMFA